jgi:hypothetical protein
MLTKEEHQPSMEATKRDPEVQKDQKKIDLDHAVP